MPVVFFVAELEVGGEMDEAGEFEKLLSGWSLIEDLVLEDPGEVVGDEDGVEAGGEGGVDVGAWTVADHPGGTGFDAMVEDEIAVGGGMFFRQDLDGGEVWRESGTVEFVGLLFGVALSDEDEAVTGGEVGEGGCDVGEQFDLVVGDGLGEAGDALMLLRSDGGVRELLEAIDERAAEALEAVAVGGDGGVLALIKVVADLCGGVDAMVKVGDEGGDGALEVDVVFPERVVGVEQQSLGCGAAVGMGGGGHGNSIGQRGRGPVTDG